MSVIVNNSQCPPQEVGDRCIITPSGYAVHSSRLGLLWITLLSGALAIRAPFLIRLSIIIRTLVGYSDMRMESDNREAEMNSRLSFDQIASISATCFNLEKMKIMYQKL